MHLHHLANPFGRPFLICLRIYFLIFLLLRDSEERHFSRTSLCRRYKKKTFSSFTLVTDSIL